MLSIHTSPLLDRAISHGEACFETMAAINGTIFDLPRHLQRLQNGCAQLGITLHDRESAQLYGAIMECVTDTSSTIRITITPGQAPIGITAAGKRREVYIQQQQRRPPAEAELISMQHPQGEQQITAKFSSNYSIMLRLGGRTIIQQGATPLLWHHNRLCSAACANIALHLNGKWLTPAVEEGGVLPGVVRHHLLQRGILHSQTCSRSTLADCDAIALLNSGILVQEVVSVDGAPCRNPQAITALRAELEDIIQHL
ncbi:MAG: aminotransferase class IV [Mariprofundales bacterium]|nr:aminotransferase class IV [Mariprofundales bacterium]